MPRVGLSDTESSHINPMYNLIYMQSPISCSLSSVDAGVNLGLPKLLQFIRGPAIYFLNLKQMGLHKKMGLQLLRCSQETSKERSTAGPAPWQQEVSQGEKMCDCIHQSQYTIRMYVKMQVKQIQISLSLYIYIIYI